MGVFGINMLLLCLWALIIYMLPMKQKVKDLSFLTVAFVQLFAVNMLRDYSVGQDTVQYWTAYQWLGTLDFTDNFKYRWETGFMMLNVLCGQLGFSFHGLLAVIGIFTYYSVFRFIYKYSSVKWMSVLIFVSLGYYFSSLHILRQIMALSIVLYSYDYIIDRRFWRFVIIVIIAGFFHNTAYLFLIAYFIYNTKPRLVVFVLCMIAAVFINMAVMNTVIGMLISLGSRYYVYDTNLNEGNGYGMLALLIGLSLIGFFGKNKQTDEQWRLLFSLVLTATVLQVFATSFSNVARLIWYWSFALLCYVPRLTTRVRNMNWRVGVQFLAAAIIVAFFFIISNAEEGVEDYMTYKFII